MILLESIWLEDPIGDKGILSKDRQTIRCKAPERVDCGVVLSFCRIYENTGKWEQMTLIQIENFHHRMRI